MEIIGKFLFLILFSVSIGAGAVYVVGPAFFTSDLDSNVFNSNRQETATVDIKQYRKKLSAEYQAYSEGKNPNTSTVEKDSDPIWEDTVDYRR